MHSDIYDDYSTPVPAAQVLFLSCCKVRKDILPQALQFLNAVSTRNETEHQNIVALQSHCCFILLNLFN